MISLLREMVEIPSTYPQEKEISQFMERYLSDKGFSVIKSYISDDRYSLLAQIGDNPNILFLGHLDTVPLVRESEWRHHPYKLTQKSDRLYGLGTYDMKAGIVAFTQAILDSGKSAKILLTIDEENISAGSWRVIHSQAGFFEGIDLVISAEPNFGLGENSITVGRTGRCVFEASYSGKEAHISRYHDGDDAIEKISRFCHILYKKRENLNSHIGSVVQVRHISGDSIGMSVCGQSQVDIEAMLSPQDSVENMQRWLENLDLEVSIKLKERKTPYLEGYRNESFPLQGKIEEIIRGVVKKEVSYDFRESVADDNVIEKLGIPVITWGPSGDNAHAPNEYVSLCSMSTMKKMYQELLMKNNT